MFYHRILTQIVFVFLVTATTVAASSSQPDSAEITWYRGGEVRLSLHPIPADALPSVVLAGTTTQSSLMVTVAKKGGRSRSNPLPLASDGSFNLLYLIKDGIGTYTVTFSGNEQRGSLRYQVLGTMTLRVGKNLPANLLGLELNDKINEFVDKVMGTTVGRGECWDLAQEALDSNLADWTRPVTFGRLLNPERDEIKAGDIIQVRNLKITEHLKNGTRMENLGNPDHTAIIYKIRGKKHYTLAHQNVNGNRSVIKSDINLANITSGQYWIYRPVALMIRQ